MLLNQFHCISPVFTENDHKNIGYIDRRPKLCFRPIMVRIWLKYGKIRGLKNTKLLSIIQ